MLRECVCMCARSHQNKRKALLELSRLRHWHLQWHDVMLHLTLSIHTFQIPHG